MRIAEISSPGFDLRAATWADLEFIWTLYRDSMKPLTEELLDWNERRQRTMIEEAIAHEGTAIIAVEGSEVGWFQLLVTPEKLHLGQLYILPDKQNNGIGTAIMGRLCDLARNENRPFTLDVMANNRALSFYKRLGFHVAGQSRYKFELKWQENH